MKFLGTIGYFSVKILVDLGISHNFLDPLVVATVKAQICNTTIMEVKVANGARVCSQGTCLALVNIQGATFAVPFHILLLGGCDIVLGVQWLMTLSTVKWDFTKMAIQCTVLGKEVCLNGIHYDRVQVNSELKILKSSFIN